MSSRIKQMDWQTYQNQPVRVYRNLNNGRISVQAKAAGKNNWKVVGHVTELVLRDVSFTVRKSGRQRAIDSSIARTGYLNGIGNEREE